MKPNYQKFIYPGILLFIFILSVFLLTRAIGFISREVNEIFSTDTVQANQALIKVNLDKYRDAAERLNLQAVQTAPPAAPAAQPATAPR